MLFLLSFFLLLLFYCCFIVVVLLYQSNTYSLCNLLDRRLCQRKQTKGCFGGDACHLVGGYAIAGG